MFYKLLLLFVLATAVNAGQQEPKRCAEFKEYCLTHSDCCSKNCMSYLYRCDRNYNEINPNVIYGEPLAVPGTLDDVLQSTFGGRVAGGNRQGHSHTQEEYRPWYRQRVSKSRFALNDFNNDEFSGPYKNRLPRQVPVEPTTAPQSGGAVVVAKQTIPDGNAAPCKEIGEKCFTEGECCTPLRCHGFLHQCVT